MRQHAPNRGTEDKTEPECRPDHPHAAGAVLGCRDVGDVRLRGWDIRAGDSAEDPRGKDQRQGARERKRKIRHARAEQPNQNDWPAADAVRPAPPDRCEHELHQRVHRC